MLAEVVLAAVIVALAVQNVVILRTHRAERERLIDAVVARHAAEFVALQAKPKAPRDPKPAPEQMEPVGR